MVQKTVSLDNLDILENLETLENLESIEQNKTTI